MFEASAVTVAKYADDLVTSDECAAFVLGYRAALDELRSDECYYEVADAKQTAWSTIEAAVTWLESRLDV